MWSDKSRDKEIDQGGEVVKRKRQAAQVIPATRQHVCALGPKLRTADVREVQAAFGQDAESVLWASFNNAKRCWSIYVDDRIIGMFGVGRRANPRIGTVWMLASDDLYAHTRVFLRECRQWVDEMMQDHDALMNYVDARNEVSIRWLAWLGFTFIKLHRGYGVHGEDFWEFVKWREPSPSAVPYHYSHTSR